MDLWSIDYWMRKDLVAKRGCLGSRLTSEFREEDIEGKKLNWGKTRKVSQE